MSAQARPPGSPGTTPKGIHDLLNRFFNHRPSIEIPKRPWPVSKEPGDRECFYVTGTPASTSHGGCNPRVCVPWTVRSCEL